MPHSFQFNPSSLPSSSLAITSTSSSAIPTSSMPTVPVPSTSSLPPNSNKIINLNPSSSSSSTTSPSSSPTYPLIMPKPSTRFIIEPSSSQSQSRLVLSNLSHEEQDLLRRISIESNPSRSDPNLFQDHPNPSVLSQNPLPSYSLLPSTLTTSIPLPKASSSIQPALHQPTLPPSSSSNPIPRPNNTIPPTPHPPSTNHKMAPEATITSNLSSSLSNSLRGSFPDRSPLGDRALPNEPSSHHPSNDSSNPLPMATITPASTSTVPSTTAPFEIPTQTSTITPTPTTTMAALAVSTPAAVPITLPEIALTTSQAPQAKPINTSLLSHDFKRRKDWTKRLVEDIEDVLQLISPTGNLLFVSESMTRQTGFKIDELLNTKLSDWCYQDEDKRNLIREIDKCTLNDHYQLNFYCRFKKKMDPNFIIFEMMGHSITIRPTSTLQTDDQLVKQAICINLRPYPTSCARLTDNFLELVIENEIMRRVLEDANSHPLTSTTKSDPPDAPSSEFDRRSSQQPTHQRCSSNDPIAHRHLEEIRELAALHPHPEDELYIHHPDGPMRTDDKNEEQDEFFDEPLVSHPHSTSTGALPATATGGVMGIDFEPGVRHRKRSKRDQVDFLCFDCGVTQSPEWRKGPMGRKTLCNACGLRFAKKTK